MNQPMDQLLSLSTAFDSATAQRFLGLQECVQEFENQPFDYPEVMDDIKGEQEKLIGREDTDVVDDDTEGEISLLSGEDVHMSENTVSSSQPTTLGSKLIDMESSGLRARLKDASKGVNEGTHGEYIRCD